MNKNKQTTVTFRTGANREDAIVQAKTLAAQLYAAIPTGEPAGQQFKNSFVDTFLKTSDRAARQAGASLGKGTAKSVLPDFETVKPAVKAPVNGSTSAKSKLTAEQRIARIEAELGLA